MDLLAPNLVPQIVAKAMLVRVLAELKAYRPSHIRNAPDEIAKLRGHKNADKLRRVYEAEARRLEEQAPYDAKAAARLREHLLGHPENYLRQPVEYAAIETVLRLLFPQAASLDILQLAANYGPFLSFLQTKRHLLRVNGIDLDPCAVQYANRCGIPVREANVSSLPFPDGSVDVVISFHFLFPHYLAASPDPSQPEQVDALDKVLQEISRVLRPAGCLVSCNEVLSSYPEFVNRSWGKGVRVWKSPWQLRNTTVFQKTNDTSPPALA